MANSRFFSWDRSFWQETTMPVGRCVSRTAVSFFCTFCPPAPLERKVSTRRSSGWISTSSASSISGTTSTEAKDVWRRLLASGGGIRLGGGELGQHRQVFQAARELVPGSDRLLEAAQLLEALLGVFGVVPEVGTLGLFAQLGQPRVFRGNVKDGLRVRPPSPGGC